MNLDNRSGDGMRVWNEGSGKGGYVEREKWEEEEKSMKSMMAKCQ